MSLSPSECPRCGSFRVMKTERRLSLGRILHTMRCLTCAHRWTKTERPKVTR